MSSDEIKQYLKEVKLEEEREKAEKALNELYEEYKNAEYIYRNFNGRYICFGKIKNIKIRKSSASKFNDCIDISFEKFYTITSGSSYSFKNLSVSEYTNINTITLTLKTGNMEQIISKEIYDSLVEKFIKIKSSINLNNFTI